MYILLERLKYFDAVRHDFMNFKQMGRNKGNVEMVASLVICYRLGS